MSLRALKFSLLIRAQRLKVMSLACALALGGASSMGSKVQANDIQKGRSAQVRADAFRKRVRTEMETAFGGPIKTQQDAINAAYLSIGWKWGEPQLDTFDQAAFLKAMSWGFRIEEFTRNGRDARFILDDLAEGPIRPQLAPVERDPRRIVQLSAGSIEPTAKKQPSVPAEDPNEARIYEVEQRVSEAHEQVAAITAEIASLEADSRAHPQNRKENAPKLQEAVKKLNALLNASQQSVASIDADVSALRKELPKRDTR